MGNPEVRKPAGKTRICEIAEYGQQPPNCSMPIKAAKQQDTVVTAERKWEIHGQEMVWKAIAKRITEMCYTYL
jgi:hypothetical protein